MVKTSIRSILSPLTRSRILFSVLAVLALGVAVNAQTVVRTNGGTETATGTDVSVVQKAAGYAVGDVMSVSGTSATNIAPFSSSVRLEGDYKVIDFTVQSATAGTKQYIGGLADARNYVLKLTNTNYNFTFKDVEFKYNQNPQDSFGIFITMNADSVSPVTLNLDNASFTNFQAPGDTRQGGVVYTMGDLSINGTNVVSFSGNKTGTGGALFGAKAITIDCDEIIFDSNACYNSGAIRHQGVLDITGSKVTFINNSARNRGGSIYATSNVKMTGKTDASEFTFSGNTAAKEGGVIYAEADKIEIDCNKITFSDNSASAGGAIALERSGANVKTSITGKTVTFDNNIATSGNGGAIHTLASVEMKGSSSDAVFTFSNNKAPNGNSGVIVAVGSVVFSTGSFIFQNNSANGIAGAIEARKAITFSGDNTSATFTGNTAGTDGNDLYLSNANSVLTFQDAGTYYFDGGIFLSDATQSVVIDKAQVTIAGRQYKPRASEDDPLEEDTTNNYQLQTVNISNGGKLAVNLDYIDSITGTINVGTAESEGTLEISVGEGLSTTLPDTIDISFADTASFVKSGDGTLELDSIEVKSLTLAGGNLKLNGSLTGDLIVKDGVFSPDAASGTSSVTGNVTITDDGAILFEFTPYNDGEGTYDELEIVGDDNAFTAGNKMVQLFFESDEDAEAWFASLVDNPDVDGYKLVSDNNFSTLGPLDWLGNYTNLFSLEGREGGLYLVAASADPGSGVPEPSTWALLVLGVLGLLYWRKR